MTVLGQADCGKVTVEGDGMLVEGFVSNLIRIVKIRIRFSKFAKNTDWEENVIAHILLSWMLVGQSDHWLDFVLF